MWSSIDHPYPDGLEVKTNETDASVGESYALDMARYKSLIIYAGESDDTSDEDSEIYSVCSSQSERDMEGLVSTRSIKVVERNASLRPSFCQLDGKAGSVESIHESEVRHGDASTPFTIPHLITTINNSNASSILRHAGLGTSNLLSEMAAGSEPGIP